jgi:hypothetical protein
VIEEIEIDRKPFYIFGTTPDSDFLPKGDLQASGGRHFAALVHHSDSRLFFIDLQTVSVLAFPVLPTTAHNPNHTLWENLSQQDPVPFWPDSFEGPFWPDSFEGERERERERETLLEAPTVYSRRTPAAIG